MNSTLSRSIQEARGRAEALPSLATLAFKVVLVLLVAIGTLSRVSPLFDFDGRLFWQHMSEDGYLMQTIARNMAIGLGMSTAEGTMPTNGVQPLATFVFAGLHWLAGGDKAGGIALVTVLSAAVALATLWAGYRVGAQVFGGMRHGRELALLSAALWFVAPRITAHSMNGLETGMYYLAILCTWNYYLGAIAHGRAAFRLRQRLVLGTLLGITFLARNDAVFFIAALLIAHWAVGGAQNGGGTHRFVDSLVAGVTSLVIASPWLIHNRIRFGSIVPLSGSAQSFDASYGQNLKLIPANLFEAAYPHFPVPSALEGLWVVKVVGLIAFIASVVGFAVFVARLSVGAKRFLVAGLIVTACIVGYYGVVFGAPHFLSRYTSSTSPFLWLCTTALVFGVLNLVFKTARGVQVAGGALVALLTLSGTAFAVKNFAQGRGHMHKQVIDWVQANVAPTRWVGAPQTGTLGFFHDRTINLDGKVNPTALRVLLREGHFLNYVLDSNIDYIVDWNGIAEWVTYKHYSERFGQEFKVVADDPRLNLAALQRIHLRPEQPPR